MRAWESAFLDLHRQVDELFDEIVYRPWAISGRSGWRPFLDLQETANAYYLMFDLPGVAPEAVRVLVGERDVVVAGERQTIPMEGVLIQRCERRCGPFERTLMVAQAVDPQRASAQYRYGTLRIYLPKKQAPEHGAQEPPVAERARFVLRVDVP